MNKMIESVPYKLSALNCSKKVAQNIFQAMLRYASGLSQCKGGLKSLGFVSLFCNTWTFTLPCMPLSSSFFVSRQKIISNV